MIKVSSWDELNKLLNSWHKGIVKLKERVDALSGDLTSECKQLDRMIASIKKDILVLEGKSSDCNKRIAQAVASMMMVREASVKMNEDVRVIKGRIKQSLPLDDEDSLDKAIRMEEKGRKKREEGKGL